jgi:transmembrane sensor
MEQAHAMSRSARKRRTQSQLDAWINRLDQSTDPSNVTEFLAWMHHRPAALQPFRDKTELRAETSPKWRNIRNAVEQQARQQPTNDDTSSTFAEPFPFVRGLFIAPLAVLAALGLMLLFVSALPNKPFYSTDIGEHKRVVLADETKVDLNTASVARTRMSAKWRLFELIRGEAHLVVTPDRERPFYVKAGPTLVRAVGTEFTVRLIDDAHQIVAMTEGRVEVSDLSHVRRVRGSLALDPSSTPKPVTASASQMVVATAGQLSLEPLSSQELRRLDAWLQDRIALENTLVADAVAELNRYSRKQLIIVDASIANMRVGGTFRTTDMEGFVRRLSQIVAVRVERRLAADGKSPEIYVHADKQVTAVK